MGVFNRTSRLAALEELALTRILVLDGAMGTMIQRLSPSEEDYRGERFCRLAHLAEGQ